MRKTSTMDKVYFVCTWKQVLSIEQLKETVTQKWVNWRGKKWFFNWFLQILSHHPSLKDATNDNPLVFMILTENEVSLCHG